MFSFAKGLAYKSMFCLGLGTATYYSYGEVQKWVHHERVQVVENVVQKQVTRENVVYNDSYSPQEIQYSPVGLALPAAPVAEGAPIAAEAAPAVAATDAPKDDEKKEGEGEKKEGEENQGEIAATGPIVPNQGPAAYYPQFPSAAAPHTETDNNTRNPAASDVPMVGAIPTPSPSSSSGSSFGGGYSGGYYGSNPTNGAIDASDIAALISPMKASFEDEVTHANGLLCTVVEGRNNCERRNHVELHSLRWGMAEGLKKDVKFKVKSLGGTNLEFAFDFKIQNLALSEELVTVSARPTETLVSTSSGAGKLYRTFEFKFNNLVVRGETVSQVQASLTYEVTPTGLVLSGDSKLTFTRSAVQLLTSRWEPLAGEPTVSPSGPIALANPTMIDRRLRNPAAQEDGGVFLIADALSFEMTVEKSQ